MLTPQEISERTFIKAVFGGYDMAGVDEFFEVVVSDYAALYKENAILKSKLKVLAKTVEEYRSVDDAMRRALLNAQKMGADQLDDAKRQSEEMLSLAREKAESYLDGVRRETALESARLGHAKQETARYISAAVRLLADGIDLLKTLPDELPEIEAEAGGGNADDVAREIESTMTRRFEGEEDAYDAEAAQEESGGGFEAYEEGFGPEDADSAGNEASSKFDLENLRFGDNYPKK